MATDTALVRQKVQTFLTRNFRTEVHSDGDFSVPRGSTRVFVRVAPHGEAYTTVFLLAPVVLQAPATPELFRYVATTDNYVFGRLVAVENDNGTVDILLNHMLLGDFLDEDELGYSVGGVVGAADSLDDELVARFGGRKLSE